jgi:hypothetical protein
VEQAASQAAREDPMTGRQVLAGIAFIVPWLLLPLAAMMLPSYHAFGFDLRDTAIALGGAVGMLVGAAFALFVAGYRRAP